MGLKKRLEDIFAASAFAEKGDFETARQIEGKKNVLLVIRGDESDRASFKYALNISKRIAAGLEILHVSPEEEVRGMMKSITSEAEREGVLLKVVKKSGCIKKEVVNYTEKRRDIQFVVVKSSGDLDEDCTERELMRAWKSLDCPLVVVSEALKA